MLDPAIENSECALDRGSEKEGCHSQVRQTIHYFLALVTYMVLPRPFAGPPATRDTTTPLRAPTEQLVLQTAQGCV